MGTSLLLLLLLLRQLSLQQLPPVAVRGRGREVVLLLRAVHDVPQGDVVRRLRYCGEDLGGAERAHDVQAIRTVRAKFRRRSVASARQTNRGGRPVPEIHPKPQTEEGAALHWRFGNGRGGGERPEVGHRLQRKEGDAGP